MNSMSTEPSSDMDPSDPERKDTSSVRHRKKHLFQQIMRLMEFYLSDSNLRKDRFFSQLLQESPEIDISVFLKCNKLARLTSDPEDVVKALKKSTLLQVTEDGTKVRRTEVVQDKPDVDECMIYVEKLPPDAEHEYIEKVFSKYGEVTYVSLPKFKSTGKLKGFAFVEFATKEEANKALEAYTEMGCRLPSTMPPESLISIQTFEGEKSNLALQHNSQDKSSIPENVSKESLDNSPPSKKVKLVDIEESEDTEDQDTPITSDTPGKKKKSRKKKKKNNDTNSDDTGMQVLSKIEWKKLRNKYLNLQRTKMQKLKSHLQSIKRTHWSHPHLMEERKKKEITATAEQDGKTEEGQDLKYGIEFVAGTIVRVHLEEPLVDVKLFKNELKHKPNVKYVDASVGSQEVFVRCINPEEANNMVESKCFPHCDILKDEEEILYWEKIEYDRRVKFSTKPKPCRGRNKLLKKAEKALGKHIRFDNVVEEVQ